LFNLPLPALWSVVLGENNRKVESGYEQRIPVDKIIMHEKYHHFKNDLGTITLCQVEKRGGQEECGSEIVVHTWMELLEMFRKLKRNFDKN
jgi:hypothetical protein